MNDIVYVDGGILIETPYFKYKNAGAKYDTPPEGAEILIPQDSNKGEPCIVIKEEKDKNNRVIVKAPSFFKEYYTRTSFTTKDCFAVFFSNTIDDCFAAFYTKKEVVSALLKKNDVYEPTSQVLYRLSIVSIVAALDTLISDLVLYIATKKRDSFLKAIELAVPSSKKNNLLKRIVHMWCDNTIDSAEQEVIDYVLRNSYANFEEIKSAMNSLYGISIDKNQEIEDIFYWRNLIAHRNGRQKNGDFLEFKKDKLYTIVESVSSFVDNIRVNITKLSDGETNKD